MILDMLCVSLPRCGYMHLTSEFQESGQCLRHIIKQITHGSCMIMSRLSNVQMEDGTQFKGQGPEKGWFENGVFHPSHVQDSARQPLPGQVGHCDYTPDHSPEGSDQVREPSLMRRKMLLMSGLRQRLCGRRSRVNIVDNATGQAKMGELVGVLGPSGERAIP